MCSRIGVREESSCKHQAASFKLQAKSRSACSLMLVACRCFSVLIVPTLRVRSWDAERPWLHSHAERGNDQAASFKLKADLLVA
ncbi:hypothetical protein FQ192_01900 [Pseudomonas sp. ANT_J12]|nr:hypothetical protein FQ192_01900 [Pseudomonas sp. ANT_J12]